MKRKDLLLLLVVAVLAYVLYKRFGAPATPSSVLAQNSSPTSATTPAAIPGAIGNLIGGITSIFTSGQPVAQASPKTV